jgi:signal transduction histidine kinase
MEKINSYDIKWQKETKIMLITGCLKQCIKDFICSIINSRAIEKLTGIILSAAGYFKKDTIDDTGGINLSGIKYEKFIKISILATGFVSLVILRQFAGAFAVSLGYLYVTLISIGGFWFGITGGISVASLASVILFAETNLFREWPARDIVVKGILLRLIVYFIAGIAMGYLAQREEQQKKEIINLNKVKNNFIGIAAHDLRNPISVIRDCSILLDDNPGNFSEQQKKRFIDIIKRSSVFMLSLINDLLDLSRIEAGKLSLNRKPCDYSVLMEEVISYNEFLAAKKKVDINLIRENRIPDVILDKEKISQVLNNIIGNAIKYTYSDTAITVSIRNDGKNVLTNIVDQGPGLTEEDARNIFKEFYKGSAKMTGQSEHESTGLGLAIAKKIVEGHGGRIWIQNTAGNGASFYFSIPLAPPGFKAGDEN